MKSRDDDGWLLQRAVYDGDEASVEGRETGRCMPVAWRVEEFAAAAASGGKRNEAQHTE